MGERLGQRASGLFPGCQTYRPRSQQHEKRSGHIAAGVFMAFASLFLGGGLDAEVNTDSPVLGFFTPKMAFLAGHHALAIGPCHSF